MKKYYWGSIISIVFLITSFSFTPLFFGPGLTEPEPIGKFLNGTFQGLASNDSRYVPAYTNLTFNSPLNFTTVPGQTRIVVGQQDGKVYWFNDDTNTSQKNLLIDLSNEVGLVWDGGFLGLSIHPSFGTSGKNYFYVYYTTKSTDTTLNSPLGFSCGVERFHGNYLVLERFEVNPSSLNFVSDSRLTMLRMRMYNTTHRGGGMEFGDDGFLYLSTGDQAAYQNAQDISDNLDGGVLRIDVDQNAAKSHTPLRRLGINTGETDEFSGIGYGIPNDNPFNNTNGSVFEEYYSMGHRNPHRMTKDRATGIFYIGEVGENRHEEINVLAPGKNYGWPLFEGNAPFTISCISSLYKNMPHQGPLVSFPRSDANSLIGGYVYRGTENPNLTGKYICADYGTGDEIWAVDTTTGEYELLGNFAPENIISFGQDYQGELYMLKQGNNVNLYKLSTSGIDTGNIPQLLSQTGAFSNLQTLDVAQGLIPYELIDSFWSDEAYKKRWMAIPNDGTHDTSEEKIAFSENGVWEFPAGSVLIKHFDYPINDNDPNQTKKIETRFSIKGDDGNFYFLTYNWNESQTDAVLQQVGLDEPIQVTTVGGGSRQVTWHFPSNSECISCHNAVSKGTLGPRTRYLNTDYDYSNHTPGGTGGNQLVTLSHLGILDANITDTTTPNYLTHTSINDTNGSLEDKARSYLDLNCAYCHQPGTGNRADFDLRLINSLAQTGLLTAGINQQIPALGSDQRIVLPGDASKSQLYHRTNSLDVGIMMPPLAKGQVDQQGVALLEAWINQLEGPIVASNMYQIVNVQNGLTLQVPNGEMQDQANITVGTYQGLQSQHVIMEDAGSGYVQFKFVHSDKYLDVAWGNSAPNTNVWQYMGNGTDAQLWELIENVDGTFSMGSKLGGHFLAVAVNNNVFVVEDNTSNQTRWNLISLVPQEPEALVLSPLPDISTRELERSTVDVTSSGGDPSFPLSFGATGLPAGISISATTGTLTGSPSSGSSLGGPNGDGLYPVVVTATRGPETAQAGFVWQVVPETADPPVDPPAGSAVVLRIKSAGPTVAATDGGPDWLGGAPSGAHGGAGYGVNTGVSAPATGMLYANRDASIPGYVDQGTYEALYAHERWDGPGAPEMEYTVPLADGDYVANLYVGNFCTCTDQVGERVYGITVEGTLVRGGLDLISEFGHQVGGMLSYPVTVSDGALNIGFVHGVENPVVNAIEILGGATPPPVPSPLALAALADRTDTEGAEVSLTASASGGDPSFPLSFGATGLPAGISISATTGTLTGSPSSGSSLGGPNGDGLYPVVVTATRGPETAQAGFVWQVVPETADPPVDPPAGSAVVLRIKSAGPTVAATDGGPDWLGGAPSGAHGGAGYGVNTGVSAPATGMLYANRDASIPGYVDQGTYEALYAHERWDGPGAPEMEYTVPLADGDYVANLYVGNFCTCTDQVGERVYGITVEGTLVRGGLDLISEFGHQVGGMLSYPVTVSDGALNIGFVHGVENPVVNAIEILGGATPPPVPSPLALAALADRTDTEGAEVSLTASASGGDPSFPLSFGATGLPAGISISATTGTLTGSPSSGSSLGGPNGDGLYPVVVTATRGPETAQAGFVWQVVPETADPPVDPPAGSAVVLRIKSAGPTVAATDGGPDWLGGAPSGAHGGAGYGVNTGVSAPATGMLYANRDASIPGYVDQGTYEALYAHERWDGPGAPEMEYTVPLADGDYVANLYVGNFCTCTDQVGERVYGITVEGTLVRGGLDLISEFGHQVGGMLSYPVTVSDGALNIGFVHGVENPVVNAIEILGGATPPPVPSPLALAALADRTDTEGAEVSLTASASGGDPSFPLSFGATGLPAGISISATTGTLTGSPSSGSSLGGPNGDGLYPVVVTATRGPETAQAGFVWQVVPETADPPVDPPAGSAVVLRIKSAGPTVAATDGGPDWLGGAPSGAHGGAGYGVNTGVSAPATGMLYANRDASIPGYVDQGTYEALYAHERWDRPGDPEMEYTVPLADGDYVANLYVGNFCTCTDQVGERVYGITVEGTLVRGGLDLISEFGHQVGGMLSYPVTVSDGALNIGFVHGVENPVVNAIEIINMNPGSVTLTTRIEREDLSFDDILVFPNPIVKGETLNLQIPGMADGGTIQLEIFSPMGAKVLQQEFSGEFRGIRELPLSAAISSGMYILQIRKSGRIVSTKKIMVR